ncbi:helix-turn-helix domain-containing protein [Roseospira navarrensis]|uniref:Chromosomal replication initiator DnaA C-terminal domain-containing protein n=1 Tax=Roseospira navarrensis TaxID=140058 RepID=A0A7X2D3I9_9PROT|nr:helix-turn-helix domain-containing protein [Roseospira navarrensis]MQX36848.1 hypothetical protein [Roseospira navarrensis]
MTRTAPSIAAIIDATAEAWGVTRRDLLADRRAQNLAVPRQAAMTLARDLTMASLPVIGRAFDRDHTTVLHAVRRTAERAARDPAIAARMDAVRARLTSAPPPEPPP